MAHNILKNQSDARLDILNNNVIGTTYSDLKDARANNQLTPGMLYRITDYECIVNTTRYPAVSCASHQFDIIVMAIATNKLSEEAFAAPHAGDTYFTNSVLSAWQLWYSLDNNVYRFGWVDTTNGKGVIYRMIDEYNNDCGYDFKNMMFAYTINGVSTPLYTFTYYDNMNTVHDWTVSLGTRCTYNTVKGGTALSQAIVFSDSTRNLFYNNTIGSCCSNVFIECISGYNPGDGGTNIVIGDSCSNVELFGNNANVSLGNWSSDIMLTSCHNVKVGDACDHITTTHPCLNSTIGSKCSHVTIGNSASTNDDWYDNINIQSSTEYVTISIDPSLSPSVQSPARNIYVDNGISGTSLSPTSVVVAAVGQTNNTRYVAAADTVVTM